VEQTKLALSVADRGGPARLAARPGCIPATDSVLIAAWRLNDVRLSTFLTAAAEC